MDRHRDSTEAATGITSAVIHQTATPPAYFTVGLRDLEEYAGVEGLERLFDTLDAADVVGVAGP